MPNFTLQKYNFKRCGPLPTCTLLEMFPNETVSVMRPRRTTEHSAHWALDQVLILHVGKCGKRKMTVSKTAAKLVLLKGTRQQVSRK